MGSMGDIKYPELYGSNLTGLTALNNFERKALFQDKWKIYKSVSTWGFRNFYPLYPASASSKQGHNCIPTPCRPAGALARSRRSVSP